MKRAVVYIRQSRHRDLERTVSPQVQRDACLAMPAVQACADVEVFADLDVSGKSTRGRQGFLAVVERVRSHRVDVVAIYDQSRAFRSTTDALEFYVLIEQHPEVDVHFVHGHFDRSPAGEFTYTTLAAAHAMERRMVAEKMRDAVRFRQNLGEMVGAVPAGYQRMSDGSVAIDEPTAAVIRRIFADYATGRYSVAKLAHRLNVEGHRLPRGKTAWRGDTVAQLLANVAYVGRTYTQSRRYRRGALVAACWPALINVAVFDTVQLQLQARARSRRQPKHTASKTRTYIFAGRLRCSCGRKMRGQGEATALYYRCPGMDGAIQCRHLVSERVLVAWVDGFLESQCRPGPIGQVRSPALSRIEEAMVRVGRRYQWGHISELVYRRQWDRLVRARDRLSGPASGDRTDQTRLRWSTADTAGRVEMVRSLFEELVLKAGGVASYRLVERFSV